MKAWTPRTVAVGAAGLTATLGVVLILGVATRGGRTSRLVDPLLRGWARAWLAPAGVRLSVEGAEHLDPRQSYVIVSNHQSNLDPIVHLAAMRVPIRFLAMRELFDLPIVGRVLRDIGMIEVDRGDPDLASIDRGVTRALSRGGSVLVYPEGGTSGDGRVDRFRSGAFVIAIAHRVPVLPTAIIGTRAVWTPGSNAIRRGTVRVVIGPPITTEGLTFRDAARLRNGVHEWTETTSSGCDAARPQRVRDDR